MNSTYWLNEIKRLEKLLEQLNKDKSAWGSVKSQLSSISSSFDVIIPKLSNISKKFSNAYLANGKPLSVAINVTDFASNWSNKIAKLEGIMGNIDKEIKEIDLEIEDIKEKLKSANSSYLNALNYERSLYKRKNSVIDEIS